MTTSLFIYQKLSMWFFVTFWNQIKIQQSFINILNLMKNYLFKTDKKQKFQAIRFSLNKIWLKIFFKKCRRWLSGKVTC